MTTNLQRGKTLIMIPLLMLTKNLFGTKLNNQKRSESSFGENDEGYKSSYDDYSSDDDFVWDGRVPNKNRDEKPSSKFPAKNSYDSDDSGSWYTVDYDDQAWQNPKTSGKGRYDQKWNHPAKKADSRKKFSVKELKRTVENFKRSRFSAGKNQDRFEDWNDEDFKNQNNGEGMRYSSEKKRPAFGGKPRTAKDQKSNRFPRSTENSRSRFSTEKNRDLFEDDMMPKWVPKDIYDKKYGKGGSKFQDLKRKPSSFRRRSNQW